MAIPFIHTRPRYFAQIVGELLYWIGEDRIQFSSDYAIWTPRWLVERFVVPPQLLLSCWWIVRWIGLRIPQFCLLLRSS